MTFLRCVVLFIGLGLLAGCSHSLPKEAQAPGFALLQEVNDLLHSAANTAGRMPARLADIPPRLQSMYPRGYAAIKSGDVVVLWGATLKGEGEMGKGDEVVVAYEKTVPTGGGFVLLSGGTIKKMTTGEFAAAPKATKK